MLDELHIMFADALAAGFTPHKAAEEVGLVITPVEAINLSRHPEIIAHIEKVLGGQTLSMGVEAVRIAHQLEHDREFAYQMGQPAAAINATVQRAKLLGVYIERTENTQNVAVSSGSALTPEEWQKKFGAEPAEQGDQ